MAATRQSPANTLEKFFDWRLSPESRYGTRTNLSATESAARCLFNCMNERGKSFLNFSFLEIAILTVVAGGLIWISMPNYIGGGHGSPTSTCINNLRQIDSAAQSFGLERELKAGDPINFPTDLVAYLGRDGKKLPVCPSGGVYFLKKLGDIPICSLGTNIAPPHVLP